VRLNEDSRVLLVEVFGSSLHAFRSLKPQFSYSVFRRCWDGKEESPQVVEALEACWRGWAEDLIRRVSRPAA
jgi:hypothetical protein